MKKKVLFLFLALLLPVAIFIFLKIFGRNEFQVSVRHAAGTIQVPASCQFDYPTPYQVADSIITGLNLNRKDSLFVFYFDASLETAMNRVTIEFEGAPVTIVSPMDVRRHMDPRLVRECVLLMPEDSSVALVDHARRVRGYYEGRERDEVDRLMVEIKIILKQY
jgi:hypothetical protein